jgi:NitT/TauT family transport system substrate-binding protein
MRNAPRVDASHFWNNGDIKMRFRPAFGKFSINIKGGGKDVFLHQNKMRIREENMDNTLIRREFLTAFAGTLMLPLGHYGKALAADDIPVRWAALQPGFTLLPVQYILANHLGRKNGLLLPDPAPYTAVSTYYNDFVAGNYDVCIGSWDTFAARYQAGVPIKYICSITDADMIALLTPKSGVSHVPGLKGKTIAALQSTGTYRMVRALIKEAFKFDIQTDATIQNVDNPAASITLLMADRADAALSWEPNITTGLMKRPDLRVIMKAGDVYKKLSGFDLPYFGVAIRDELMQAHPGIAAKVGKVFEEAFADINADPAKAIDLFGSKTGVPVDVLKEAMGSKRLTFRYRSMSNESARLSIKRASEFLTRNGLLTKPIDDDFFAV